MIRLFTTLYDEQDPVRRAEYRRCIEKNIACQAIEQIIVFCEGGEVVLPEDKKICVQVTLKRPTYRDYFDLIAIMANEHDISVVSNTDIFFDHQLKLFTHWWMPQDTVFALSRWDLKNNARPRLYDHNDSQDAWIFRGLPRDVYGNFPVGTPRCDNRIAAEFAKAGYSVLNPSFSLRCYHVHESPPRPYLESEHSEKIPPPYKYVWPHNLFGLFRTLTHNLKHSESKLYWRFDHRKFTQWFPIRVLLKIARVLRIGK